MKRRAKGGVINNTFKRFPEIVFLQSLRSQRVHLSARFAEAPPSQFAGAMQMIVRFFATAARKRILGCFQLHNYTGETLRERVVDVARHSISFFGDSSSLTLIGKLVELNGKHDLVGERL